MSSKETAVGILVAVAVGVLFAYIALHPDVPNALAWGNYVAFWFAVFLAVWGVMLWREARALEKMVDLGNEVLSTILKKAGGEGSDLHGVIHKTLDGRVHRAEIHKDGTVSIERLRDDGTWEEAKS